MLYDNALLARVYLHAWQLTGEVRYRQVVSETLEYLLRPPVRLAGGGLASAEDADSEGVEGRFYVWDEAEVRRSAARPRPSGTASPRPATGRATTSCSGRSAQPLIRPPEVEAARQALFARRERTGPARPGRQGADRMERHGRRRPGRGGRRPRADPTGWPPAEEIGDFLLGQPATAVGRPVAAQLAGGRRSGGAATWPTPPTTPGWSRRSSAWPRRPAGPGGSARPRAAADALLDLFMDAESGAFHMTGHDAEALIARPIDSQDGAVPVGQLGRRRRPLAPGRPHRRGALPRARPRR